MGYKYARESNLSFEYSNSELRTPNSSIIHQNKIGRLLAYLPLPRKTTLMVLIAIAASRNKE